MGREDFLGVLDVNNRGAFGGFYGVKQGKHFTTAKIFKKVRKTLFVTVTLLSPNFQLNDSCFKIIVDTRTITENCHMAKVTFLHHICC